MQPVAIIGMACIYPGAPDLAAYWHNIVNGVDAISDVPPARWDPVFYDPAARAVDRFYCRRGGFVDAYADFDPLRYGVMPNAVAAADPDQLLSLRVGSEALADAGYATREFPRARTGVVIGRGNYIGAGAVRLQQQVRLVEQTLQFLRDLLPGVSPAELAAVRAQIRGKLEHYGPDVAVGLIPNLAASRLANRLDLHGPAYTLDAACASSLIAVEQACAALTRGDADMMLAGGLHFTHDLSFWATFCQLGALSRSQQVRPLAQDADGILAGEGIGMLALKRLDDAERDGDRIYAVLEGIASASDGRAASLLAPAPEGQRITLERAWRDCTLPRASVGLVEAHGTGTPTGDRTELETLAEFFGNASAGSARDVIGSVKSMIGHTMPAAGAAGLIKAALAVHHGVLPPTLHCERPHPALASTRFRVTGTQERWERDPAGRVACVNAFGFGGINAHAVLRGYDGARAARPAGIAPVARRVRAGDIVRPSLVFLAADSPDALLARLDARNWSAHPGSGAWRLALLAPDEKRIALARGIVERGQPWHGRQQVWFAPGGTLAEKGRIAFVFPGIDSRFTPRADDIAAVLGIDLPAHCRPLDPGTELLDVSLGVSAFNGFLHEALARLAIRPDAMAGHSNGEWSAMTVSGMLDARASTEELARMDPASVQLPDVAFLAAACDLATLRGAIAGNPGIVVSHDNCPHQVIACGDTESIAALADDLARRQVLCQRLPFASGFHTPFMAVHIGRYRDFFARQAFAAPRVPVWSATIAAPYPADAAACRQLAVDHLLQTVRFRETLLAMHAAGIRTFIQVGTGSLPGFIDDTLRGLPHLAIAANVEQRSGLEQLAVLCAALWVEGGTPDVRPLLAQDRGFEATHRPGNREAASHAAPQAMAAAPGKKSPAVRLALGVPLMRLDRPLRAVTATDPAAIAADTAAETTAAASHAVRVPADPVERSFHAAFAGLQQAQGEILAAWRQRRARASSASASASASASTSASTSTSTSTSVRRMTSAASTSTTPVTSTAIRENVAQLVRSAPAAAHATASGGTPAPFDVTLTRRLDMDGDTACVRDHARFPQGADWPVAADHDHVVPLTMEVAMLCREIESRLPGQVVIELRDVQAYRWLGVGTPRDIDIRLRMQAYPHVDAEIAGHLRARATVAPAYPAPPVIDVPPLGNARPAAIDAHALYADDWMFHGPAYRGVVQLGPVGDNGIDGRLRVPAGDGGLLDNMGQLAGYRVMEEPEDCLAMPIGVDRIRLFRAPPPEGAEFFCSIRLRRLDQDNSVTDQVLRDDTGTVVATMEGWHARRFPMPHDFWLRSKSWQNGPVCDELAPGVMLFHDCHDTAVVRDYIAKRVLNQPETAEYEAQSPRRRRQWLNGRVAAKDAVRALLWRERAAAGDMAGNMTGKSAADIADDRAADSGHTLYPKRLHIRNLDSGQPVVENHLRREFDGTVHVSIAHKGAHAVAVAGRVPVGIDVEDIAPRDASFLRAAFSAAEMALLPDADRDAWIARCWVAKEVIAKQRGSGLRGRPADFPVTALDATPGVERVCIAGAWVDTRRHRQSIVGWRTVE